MSHTRAYAYVSAVSPGDLRPTLVTALEALYNLSDALEVSPPREARLLEIEGLEDSLLGEVRRIQQAEKDSRQAEEEADERASEAESRLEAKLQASPDDLALLRMRVEEAEASRDAAIERLGKVKHMVEAHADLVAGARKFVSASIDAGVPIKHARAVTASKRKSG